MRPLLSVSVLMLFEILCSDKASDRHANVTLEGLFVLWRVHSEKVSLVAAQGKDLAARLTGDDGMHVFDVTFKGVFALEHTGAAFMGATERLLTMNCLYMLGQVALKHVGPALVTHHLLTPVLGVPVTTCRDGVGGFHVSPLESQRRESHGAKRTPESKLAAVNLLDVLQVVTVTVEPDVRATVSPSAVVVVVHPFLLDVQPELGLACKLLAAVDAHLAFDGRVRLGASRGDIVHLDVVHQRLSKLESRRAMRALLQCKKEYYLLLLF